MAVGDYVNGVFPVNTTVNFQPAVGVTICLTHAGCNTQWSQLTDGVNTGKVLRVDQSSTATNPQNTQCRLFINNTNYLYVAADPSESTQYSGIQVS